MNLTFLRLHIMLLALLAASSLLPKSMLIVDTVE